MTSRPSINMAVNASGSYLELNKCPVRFEPVTGVNNVFFDEANKQIFAVRSGGATGVIVSGPDDKTSHSFRLNDKGPLISIKFSYHHKILALQRSNTTIEFANFEDGSADPAEYTLTCRGKTNKILTFHWISTNEIVLVTQGGIEFYQINIDKRQPKLIKHYNFSVNWSIFSPESSVLLCSTSTNGTVICPFYFKNLQVFKLPRFEVDRTLAVTSEPRIKLFERDITMVTLYNNLYVAILHHPSSQHELGTEVHLYLLTKDNPAKKKFCLVTKATGRFAVSALDSLVVVHHQTSKTSMLFDIKLPGEKKSSLVYFLPIVDALPIKTYKRQVSKFGLGAPAEMECELYSPTWIVFQPNIIIDASLGFMWYLRINLESLPPFFKDTCTLIDFLLLRRGSKAVILKVIRKMLLVKEGQMPVWDILLSLFHKLNSVYKEYTEAEQLYLQMRKSEGNNGTGASTSAAVSYPPHRLKVVIDQSDMYTHVLAVMARQSDIDPTLVCRVVIEYIRSLNDHKLAIQHYFYELIINSLIDCQKFHQLQQYFHFNLIADSRTIAGHLLSRESSYPAAYQTALDMYKRLSTSNDEIVDILLSKRKVLPALRFVKSVSMQDTVSARKFLEAASQEDDILFYDTFKFFQSRNLRLRGRKDFTPGELCDKYVKHFETLFGNA